MKLPTNGTKIWCQTCDTYTICQVISLLKRCKDGNTAIRFLSHDRKCLKCKTVFTTAEVDHSLIAEISRQRSVIHRLLAIRYNQTKLDELLSSLE